MKWLLRSIWHGVGTEGMCFLFLSSPMFEYAFNKYFFWEKAHDFLYLYLNNSNTFIKPEKL